MTQSQSVEDKSSELFKFLELCAGEWFGQRYESVSLNGRAVILKSKSKFRDTPTQGRTKENLRFYIRLVVPY